MIEISPSTLWYTTYILTRLHSMYRMYRMYPKNMNTTKGFTLMEAMITIAIIGILSSIAAPSFQSYIANEQTSSIATDLFSDLRSLRQLSMSTASNVVICATSNESTCLPNVANANDWTIGWIAFLDLNQNNQRDSASEDILILQAPLTDGDITYSGGAVLTFDYQGEISNSQQFSICSTNNDSELSRAIIVNKVGRALRVQPSQLNTVISCS